MRLLAHRSGHCTAQWVAYYLGQSRIVSQAIESIARQPEAADSIRPVMFVGLAFAETSGIYGLLIAIIMLYANPLMNALFNAIR